MCINYVYSLVICRSWFIIITSAVLWLGEALIVLFGTYCIFVCCWNICPFCILCSWGNGKVSFSKLHPNRTEKCEKQAEFHLPPSVNYAFHSTDFHETYSFFFNTTAAVTICMKLMRTSWFVCEELYIEFLENLTFGLVAHPRPHTLSWYEVSHKIQHFWRDWKFMG